MHRKFAVAIALSAFLTLSPSTFDRGLSGSIGQAKAEEPTRPPGVSPEALKTWGETMHRTPPPAEGCFEGTYPSTQWQAVQCAPPPGWRSAPHPKKSGALNPGQQVGGGLTQNDIVAQAPTGQVFSAVVGSFLPQTAGVTNESDPSGIFSGKNEYSLQLNTNIGHTSACGAFTSCIAWQQYVFATNITASVSSLTPIDETAVFIEYWLFDYGVHNGSDICPTGFLDNGPSVFGGAGDDCVQNSPAHVIQSGQLAITDLANLTLSGTATPNGTDVATATVNGHAYAASVADSLTAISSIWNQAEFNVVGNAGATEAVFNNGVALWVQVAVTDGSTAAPTCVFNGGTTGESNNLNFVPSTAAPACCPYGGTNPRIQFIETSTGSSITKAGCGSTGIWGDPHINTVDGNYYNFQAAGEFVALQDAGGAEIQTRQTPLTTVGPGNYDPNGLDNNGLSTCLAMNTAVAARVGSHRVTYEPPFTGPYNSGPYQLRIDGKLTTLGAKGLSLAGGGQVRNSSEGGGIEIDFPDGKILTAIPGLYASMNHIDVNLENVGLISGSAGASQSGLAAAFAKGSWLPALPTGASVGPMPSALHDRFVTLYSTFADAWRVKESNSLFDYAPNTSTATFTNTAWPVENASTCTVPNQTPAQPISPAEAKEVCKSVSDKARYSSCLSDVEATGVGGFADTYGVTERVHEALRIKPIDAGKLIDNLK